MSANLTSQPGSFENFQEEMLLFFEDLELPLAPRGPGEYGEYYVPQPEYDPFEGAFRATYDGPPIDFDALAAASYLPEYDVAELDISLNFPKISPQVARAVFAQLEVPGDAFPEHLIGKRVDLADRSIEVRHPTLDELHQVRIAEIREAVQLAL